MSAYLLKAYSLSVGSSALLSGTVVTKMEIQLIRGIIFIKDNEGREEGVEPMNVLGNGFQTLLGSLEFCVVIDWRLESLESEIQSLFLDVSQLFRRRNGVL